MSDNLIGATTAIFIVSLSIAVNEPVDVAWSTRDGTAKAGTDYQAANGVVTFLPGETEKQIEVIVYGQNVSPTGDKNFFINLTPPTNAVLGTALIEAVIKIEDEAGVPVTSVIVAQGKRGLKGDPGLSAYEQAVLMGYDGTLEDWMQEQADAAAAAQRASDYAANAAAAATKAENAATAASFLGNIFPTPEAGVDPVTGVGNGAYYNVRSTDDDSYLVEYQNIGGVPTPTGKSFPSAAALSESVNDVAKVKEAIIDPVTGLASADKVYTSSGDSQEDVNNTINSRIEVIRDRAIFLDEYHPGYSSERLSDRFSTIAEARIVYPSARSLTDYVDQTALQQAINDSNGRQVITPSGRDIYLNTVGVTPDGHAGEYCLLASNSVEIRPTGSTRSRLIVPTNTHGLIGMADDITVDNMHFYSPVTATADIGHMVKFIKTKRGKVYNCQFTNVSDVAVNFGYHYMEAATAMDIAIANGQLSTFDMFQFGSSDFEYIGNTVDDCYGDGGLEVQASVRGKITRNDHRNCRGHGYRIVGCKDTDIYNNHGADIGTASTFSAMLSLFSGALTRNGNTAWMYNEDLRVHDNTGDNVKDSIHMGLGGLNLSVFDNDIGAWNRGLYVFHTNPTCRYGLKDSRIYRNKLRSAKGKLQAYGAHLALGVGAAKPLQGALLDNVEIVDNDFDFSLKSMYTEFQTTDHKIINSKIRNHYFTATSTSVASSATGTTLDYVENTDLSGGSNNIANGTELIVTNPFGSNKYGKRDELKFTRSGDTLVMQSRVELKTGQLATVRFTSGGALPAPLTINTPYYLIVVDTKTVKLATSLTNALSGTAIPLTSDTVLHNFLTLL